MNGLIMTMQKKTARKAVDPIIASLLLIAIAVAAGIIVYVYVNSLAGGLTSGGGSQVSQQLQLQAYTFTGVSGTTVSSNGVIADITLENTGSSSLTISAIYFDGNALTELGAPGGPYSRYFEPATAANANCFAAIPAGVALTAYTGASQTTSGATGGCATNIAQTNCGTVTCFQTAAGGQTETLTLAAQAPNQLVITLASAATSGTSHTVKIVTANGGVAVFTLVAGRTG
jgi:hypothetical protein